MLEIKISNCIQTERCLVSERLSWGWTLPIPPGAAGSLQQSPEEPNIEVELLDGKLTVCDKVVKVIDGDGDYQQLWLVLRSFLCFKKIGRDDLVARKGRDGDRDRDRATSIIPAVYCRPEQIIARFCEIYTRRRL